MVKWLSSSILMLSVFSSVAGCSNTAADLVIFSYDRPLQLYAYLESVKKHVSGLGQTLVLGRASSSVYKKAYGLVAKAFPGVGFFFQDPTAAGKDFKPLLTRLLTERCRSPYLIFGVDDIVVCDAIDISTCTSRLQQHEALGFFLRLGKNIVCSNVTKLEAERHFQVPKTLQELGDGVCSWRFDERVPMWRYHHSLDMTIYPAAYAKDAVKRLSFHSPNTLEVAWSREKPAKELGLCFNHSKMVNLPLNLVQREFDNNNMGILSAEVLLSMFIAGLKMDVDTLHNYDNNSPHMHYIPSFKPR